MMRCIDVTRCCAYGVETEVQDLDSLRGLSALRSMEF